MHLLMAAAATGVGTVVLLLAGRQWQGVTYLYRQWRYQLVTLIAAMALYAVALRVSGAPSQLRIGELQAPASGMQFLGYDPADSWLAVAIPFTVIAALVTTLVVWLQVLRGHQHSPVLPAMPSAIVLSAANALTEELIFRAVPLALVIQHTSHTNAALLCAVMFAIPHWVGTPGGPVGALMAGALGYVAALSIIGTGGLLIAWAMHVAQDVPIFTMRLVKRAE